MKNQFKLDVKTPCSENFDQFKPTGNGGFCGSCQKEVIDFTRMNSAEIINYFEHTKMKNTCGKFNSNQLNTYNSKRKKVSFLSGIGLACLSVFSLQSTQAQDVKKSTETSDKIPPKLTVQNFRNLLL